MPRITGSTPTDAVDGGPPSGPAGGVLAGTYPNPSFAADMATQAELDAHIAADPIDHPDGSVTDAKLAEDYIKADGTRDFTADQSMAGNALTNVPAPVDPLDAVNKAYVDAVAVTGLDVHLSVRAATTGNITLADEQTIDGVAVVAGDRVLVKNQTAGEENGFYDVVAVVGWTRSTDADTGAEVNPGIFTFVEEGTVNADTGWVLITDDPITLDTTELVFAQFSAAGQLVPGAALVATGSTWDVGVDNSTVEVNADALRVKDLGITAAKLAANSVTTAKILNANVTTAKILDANVTDAKLASSYIYADGTRDFTGNQSMATFKVTDAGDPTAAQDYVTKNYADAIAAGLTLKIAVRLASAAALAACTYDNGTAGVGATLTADANGALSIDGVAVALNDRVLIKDQVAGLQNGPYHVTATGSAGTPFILTRETDADEADELFESLYFVTAGTANTGLAFYLTNTTAPTIGTDALTYAQFLFGGSNGNGLKVTAPITKAGSTLALNGINSLTGKATPVDADNFIISDSAASHVPKKSTWANLKATFKTYFDTLYQSLDAELTAIAGLTSAADKGIQFTGSGTAAVYDLTAAGKALLDDASAKAQRATILFAKGADVASANNLALGADGLVFHITGTTQINLIADTNFNAGDTIVLIFDGACLVKHNQTVSGANKPILLMGDVDWTTAANDVLALTYDGTSWYDTRRGLLSQMGVIPINNQSGTTYAPVLADRGKLITCTNASAITVTIPANASVAFPIGTVMQIKQGGVGQVTVAITSDTLNAPNGAKTALQNSYISLTKVAATTWDLSGDSTA